MLKVEKTSVHGWEPAIRGMRNPLNSWDKSDSKWNCVCRDESFFCTEECEDCEKYGYELGPNDYDLAKRLIKAGPDHRKFMRMLIVFADVRAPLYWWKEYDTYKVGTVANSTSTMHKIHANEFSRKDFSCEKLFDDTARRYESDDCFYSSALDYTIGALNDARKMFILTQEKRYWDAMIQLLPSSYNQLRTVELNYEVLHNMYHARKSHKLSEWHDFCDWVKSLPYSEFITGHWDEVAR